MPTPRLENFSIGSLFHGPSIGPEMGTVRPMGMSMVIPTFQTAILYTLRRWYGWTMP